MDNEDSPHLKKIKLLKPHIKIVRIFCGGMNYELSSRISTFKPWMTLSEEA